MSVYQDRFQALLDALRAATLADEQFTLSYNAEHSQFVRFNHAKVRQAGEVSQACVQLRLVREGRQAEQHITLSDDAVIHLRPSGNAPELRCYAESSNASAAATLVEHTLAQLKKRSA